MKVTLEELNKLDACYAAVEWFKQQKTNDIYELLELAKTENHLDWANWYLDRILNNEQKIQYAIFAAESVLHIYEEKYPNNNAPRKAIEATKNYLEDQTKENRQVAVNAADAAARGAARATVDAAYAYYAARAAVDAAYAYYAARAAARAAYYAARATVDAATYAARAARAAVDAATYAARAADAKKELMIKILEYGLSLVVKK